MSADWKFVEVVAVRRRNEDAAAIIEYQKRDLENARVYPYVARILALKVKDPRQREHSPVNRRKMRPAIMALTPRFHYYVLHFACESYEELQSQLQERLEREIERRKATAAELMVGKFITPFDCIGLNCHVDTKTDLATQLQTIREHFDREMPAAQQLLPYPGRGIARF